jgi:hypothetical protein
MTFKLSLLFRFLAVILVLAARPLAADAAESTPAMTARESGVALYSRQDVESERIATLEKGEMLTPIAESVGSEIWYIVRSKHGLVGWVRAADVVLSNQAKDAFKEKKSSSSTWSARTSGGRTFNGTWNVALNSTDQSASGAWTLTNATGATITRGTWSAEKHATGWNGTWRATVEGREAEYAGSWSAEFPHVRNARFAELFEAAAKEAIRGLWTGGSESGSWSIRVVK